jgi:predicted ribosomally synthesized peptide with nif11-like leader
MSYALFCLMALAVILVIPGEIMSLEDVKAFYQRLGTDEAFRAQIQGVNSKDECSQTVKSAGYDFTREELEEYTAELLELTADEDGLADLDEKELATVFGGSVAQQRFELFNNSPQQELMKLIPPESRKYLIVPSYGAVIRPQDFPLDFPSVTITAQPFMPLLENSKQV